MPKQDRCPGDDPPANQPLRALQALRGRLDPGSVQDPDERGPAPTVGPAPHATRAVGVRRERKGRGGKTVTRIEHALEGTEGREALAKELKRDLGSGARWEGEDLVIQGDLVERVARWFERRGRAVTRGN